MPLLLEGDDPVLAVLREQYRRSTITEIEITGVGVYAEFDIHADAPRTDPPSIVGGNAVIELDTAPHGAGCVVFVSDGCLGTFEGFTYDGEWTEATNVIGVGDVTPLKWKGK
jgi:hypothetical protein